MDGDHVPKEEDGRSCTPQPLMQAVDNRAPDSIIEEHGKSSRGLQVTNAVSVAADRRSTEEWKSSSIDFMLCVITVIRSDDEES
ncbi:hypothetical protein BHM03_00043441 [Ensete ventricosum]|nr:hypothetical protein BHM03_00043441 [Ensete ventricosum]